MKKRVVIGLLGTKLDRAPARGDRWSAWRPSVALCQHEDLLVDRLELLYHKKDQQLRDQVVADIHAVSPETEVRCSALQVRDPWDFEEVFGELHQFASEYEFEAETEEYLVHITTGTHVAQICLFLLTETRHFPGQLLQTSPPARRQSVGRGRYRVIDLDLSRYDALASRFQQERFESQSVLKSGIETRNKTFNALIEQIECVALASQAPTLITGPTGAGKSHLARQIYDLKKQRGQVNGDLVEANCATLRGDHAMSMLFGHVKGAFTGAMKDRAGLLRAADGGILFLDEIGELGLDEQAMLLRAIEEKRFYPVGGDDTVTSEFQLIAGTNRDLGKAVLKGQFREDLLARINLWTFRLPGLAERRDDIEPNIDFELQRFTKATGQRITMNREARERFLKFAMDPQSQWTGNFRDLNAAVTRMATLAENGRISMDGVRDELRRLEMGWNQASSKENDGLTGLFSESQLDAMDLFDKLQLSQVVRECRQHKSLSAAGRALFQASRKAKAKPNDADRLRKYLAKFGLQWDRIQETG